MLTRSSASLASSPPSIVTAVQRRPPSRARHRRKHMGADRLVGIADRNRDLEGSLNAAPHIEPLRSAADEDRDRLERELRFARRLGGVSPLGLGRLGGVLRRRGSVALRFRVGLGGVELRPQLRGLGGGLRFRFSARAVASAALAALAAVCAAAAASSFDFASALAASSSRCLLPWPWRRPSASGPPPSPRQSWRRQAPSGRTRARRRREP